MADTAEMLRQAIETLSAPVPEGVKYGGVSMAPIKETTAGVKEATGNQQQVIEDASALNEVATQDYKQGQLAAAAAVSADAAARADQAARVASNYDVYAGLAETQKQLANVVAASTSAILIAKPAADQELRTIQEMQSVGLMDDPLEWAYNQIQLPSKIKAYNAAATEINSAQETIDSAITNIANIAVGGSKNVPAITTAMAKAEADKASAAAAIANALADEKLAKQNVDFATKNTAAAVALAGVTDNTTRIQQREAELQYQSQINAITIADTKANRILKSLELQDKLSEVQKEQVIYKQFDKVMGRAEGTTTSATVKRLPKEMQAEIFAIGSAGKYGFGPADALENFRNFGLGAALPDTTKNILGFLVQKEANVLESIDKDITAQMASGKLSAADKQKERKAKIDVALTSALNEELKNPDSKLFGPATPKEILLSGLVPQGSPLSKILSPLAETTSPVDVNVVYEAIKVALPNNIQGQGDLLSQYARLAKEITIGASNVKAFGNAIRVPKGYIVSALDPILTTPGGANELRRRITLDLTDSVDARKYVLIKNRPELPINLFSGRIGSK